MAAFPTARAHAHLPGQGSVEFILIMPVLLTFLFAIGSFAMLSYQNTVIQHSLATLRRRASRRMAGAGPKRARPRPRLRRH